MKLTDTRFTEDMLFFFDNINKLFYTFDAKTNDEYQIYRYEKKINNIDLTIDYSGDFVTSYTFYIKKDDKKETLFNFTKNVRNNPRAKDFYFECSDEEFFKIVDKLMFELLPIIKNYFFQKSINVKNTKINTLIGEFLN
jgi:hypothetical protein